MIKSLHRIALATMLALTAVSVQAQIAVLKDSKKFNTDSLRRDFDKRPFFGIYKDNYFTVGTTIGSKPTAANSDVKFQVSIAQRLTNSVLPFHSYLFLMYTQKCMWNVFENSMPMRDLNFNPGIGISKLLISRGHLIGKITLLVEHESNGRDRLASRSWNKVSLGGNIYVDPNFMVHGKIWIPIVDGGNNRDILKYSGIYQTGIQVLTPNRRWVMSATFVKRKNWNPFSGNVSIDVGFRLRRSDNQFLFVNYYNGYGENLLDYNKFHSRLRIGLLIKPKFFSDF